MSGKVSHGLGFSNGSIIENSDGPSSTDELIKLVQLRDSGVLSPAEFESQKARLLR